MWNCLFSRGLPLILLLLLLLTKTPPIHPDMFNLLLPLPSNTDLTSNPSSSYLLNFPIIICSPSKVITCTSSAFSSSSTDPPRIRLYLPSSSSSTLLFSCLDWWAVSAKLMSAKPFSDPVLVGYWRQSKFASDQTKILLPLVLSAENQL